MNLVTVIFVTLGMTTVVCIFAVFVGSYIDLCNNVDNMNEWCKKYIINYKDDTEDEEEDDIENINAARVYMDKIYSIKDSTHIVRGLYKTDFDEYFLYKPLMNKNECKLFEDIISSPSTSLIFPIKHFNAKVYLENEPDLYFEEFPI